MGKSGGDLPYGPKRTSTLWMKVQLIAETVNYLCYVTSVFLNSADIGKVQFPEIPLLRFA